MASSCTGFNGHHVMWKTCNDRKNAKTKALAIEEEQSSLKRLEETIPELFQCAVVRQMGIDLFI